jgi:SH3-like domain-containing protein
MKATLAFLTLALSVGAAHALDYKSVGTNPAVLYDAPSAKGRKLFVAPRGMPVEVVLTYGEWSKVRDVAGDLTWVESKMLSPRRSVIVNVPGTKVRSAAEESAAIVFTADKGVLLDLLEPASQGWAKVKHRDGQVGFVKATDVWGE